MKKTLASLLVGVTCALGLGGCEGSEAINSSIIRDTAYEAGWKYVGSVEHITGCDCTGCEGMALNKHKMTYAAIEGINSNGKPDFAWLCCLIPENSKIIGYCKMTEKKSYGCSGPTN